MKVLNTLQKSETVMKPLQQSCLITKIFDKLCECGIIDNTKTVDRGCIRIFGKKLKYIGMDELNNSCISPLVKNGVFEKASCANNCVFADLMKRRNKICGYAWC